MRRPTWVQNLRSYIRMRSSKKIHAAMHIQFKLYFMEAVY